MLLRYNYDNLNKVIKLFQDNNIAKFTIQKKEPGTFVGSFVMEYSTVEQYDGKRQEDIRRTLHSSLPERLRTIEILNAFQEAVCCNADTDIKLDFDAVNKNKCILSYNATGIALALQKADNISKLYSCMCQMDHILIDMGITEALVDGVYTRHGKSKKYTQPTFGQLNHAIRKSIDRHCCK